MYLNKRVIIGSIKHQHIFVFDIFFILNSGERQTASSVFYIHDEKVEYLEFKI
jgi:hypothetical protein